ncbi:MAG: type III pantothenate kinase [Planctomycetota bacterium]|jgi:type III pantothenate kinase|nr:type III pantothenate kinase [Planctomycetota bacterium]
MLAIDIGNTSLRFAAFAAGEKTGCRSFPVAGLRKENLQAAFSDLLPLAERREAWIASVVPAADRSGEETARILGIRSRFIRSGADDIISHRLASPETTGVDRLLAALGAGMRHFSGLSGRNGYAAVQCGSAATIDWVDANGVFRGGYLLPGPKMWLAGLALAAGIPDYSDRNPEWENLSPGGDTAGALAHGLAVGLPAAVAAAFFRIRREAGWVDGGKPFPVAITGGWGRIAAGLIPASILDDDLLFHGICAFVSRLERRGT